MPVGASTWNVDKWVQHLSKAHRRLALVTMQQHEGSSITVSWLCKPNESCVFRQSFASNLISFFTSEVINDPINLKNILPFRGFAAGLWKVKNAYAL